jgi:membrane protein implicated in regulation of membrane protease activity
MPEPISAVTEAPLSLLQYGIAGVVILFLGVALVAVVKYIVKRIEDGEKAQQLRDAEYKATIAALQQKNESIVGGIMMEQQKTQAETNRLAERMCSVAEHTSHVAERFMDIHHASAASESGSRRGTARLDR